MTEDDNVKKERLSTKAQKKLFLEALPKSLGIWSQAMKIAGIGSYNTIKKWRDNDPKFKAALEDVEEYAGDFAESALLKKIKNGDTTAIIFYLKTKQKKRGYTERTEITGVDGRDLFNQKTDEELDAEIAELRRKLGETEKTNGNKE